MPRLVFIDGRNMGNAVPLHGAATIGRARGNSIVLDEPAVLDRHAEIACEDGQYRIARADPAAPLSVNGKPAAAHALRHGDVLSLGPVTLLFSDESQAPDLLPTRAADPSDPRLRSSVRPFPDAATAATAIRRGSRAEERLETLYRIAGALHAACTPDDLVRQLLDHLPPAFRPERCLALLRDEQGRLRLQGQRLSGTSRLQASAGVPAPILQLAFDRKEAISASDPQGGPLAVLCAPLVRGDLALGLLYLDRTADAWGEDDLHLLNAVASQAAAALDTLLAHQREAEFGRALVRLGEGSRLVSSYLGRDAIVREAVEQACRVFDCTKASVLLLDPKGEHLTVAWSNCIDPRIWPGVKIPPGEGHAGRVFREGKPMLSVDAHGERRYETASFLIAPVVSQGEGLRSDPRAVGVISATDKASGAPFTPRDQEILSILAAQVGIALTNAGLFERATVDPLTRLYTRQYFDFRLAEEVREHRARGAPLALLMCDLDHFKDKNDIYGHPVGDVILAEAAAILRQNVPGFAARYGGEEFAGILPGVPAGRAEDLAKDIRRAVEEHSFNAGDEPLRCTISIGVAALSGDDGPEALIKKADEALYSAKRRGRNRVETYEGRLR